MGEDPDPQIPDELQPRPADVDYDLDGALSAIVALRATVPEDAFTAPILGTERQGHGVQINDAGLIVTIGYVITEAEDIWLVTDGGQARQGHVVGYDYETGFGLVQALGSLDCPVMTFGSAADLSPGDNVVVAGHGGPAQSVRAQVAGRREFAGYWEYVLDEALFTFPPHPNWGGAAVIDPDGRLCAVGSLYINDVLDGSEQVDGNMSVPVDLLLPIMDELTTYGRTLKPARPWLGVFISEAPGRLLIAGAYEGAPAEQAGLRPGDAVLAVGEQRIDSLSGLFRAVWALGPAGTEIPLTMERDGEIFDARLASVDRRDFWRSPSLH